MKLRAWPMTARWCTVAACVVPLCAGVAGGQALDRSKRPVVPPPPSFAFPDVRTHTLPNGLTLRIVENHALPLVAVRAFIEGGTLLDPAGKEGLFALDTLLMRDGTASMSGEQIASAIDEMGAPISPTRFTTVTAEFERSFALMADMLARPSFPAEAVSRRKDAATATLQRMEGTASTPALRIFNATLWGQSHPYARVASPTSIAAITRDDIVRFHDANIRPQNVTITVVGDLAPAAVIASATKLFGDWQRTGERVTVKVPAAPASKPTTIYLYDRPGSAQSTVFIGQTAPSRTTPDFYALETMGVFFGGPTGSRLTMALRENRPLTYAISHAPVWRRVGDPASIHGSSNVDAAKTDSAVIVWLGELKRLAGATPPADSELAFARSATVGGLLTRIETIDEVANRLNLVARDGLPANFYDGYVRGMSRVTAADVGAAAARTIDPARTAIVVVGDRRLIEAALRAANVAPVVIVDQYGSVIP